MIRYKYIISTNKNDFIYNILINTLFRKVFNCAFAACWLSAWTYSVVRFFNS